MAKQKATKASATRTRKPQARPKTRSSTPNFFTRYKMIILPLIVVALVGSIGVWTTFFSDATTALSSEQCKLRGRVYDSGTCYKRCVSGAGSLKYGTYFDWCENAISTSLSSTTCNGKGRKYVASTGCSRRWQQTNATGAIQCIDSKATYIVASVDYCKSPTSSGGSTTTSSNWIWPVTPNNGVGAYDSGHYARDFRAAEGTTVRAVANGAIVWKGQISSACGNGLIMKVRMSDGSYLYPTYEHIRFSSASGSVSQGTTLGWVSSVPSGYNDCWKGYHLHLGVQKQGGYVESHRSDSSAHPDPCRWIDAC